MRKFIEIAKALSDSNRVRILMVLRNRELCVCQITELLTLAPSTVSKHIAILDHARFVDSRKEGRWVYYRLANDDVDPMVSQAIAWLSDSLEHDNTVLQDEIFINNMLVRGCLEKIK